MKVGKIMTVKKNNSSKDCLINETILIALGFSFLGKIPFNSTFKKMYMSKHYAPKDKDKTSYFIIEHEVLKTNTVYKFHVNKNKYFKIETLEDLQTVHNLHAESDILSYSNIENDNNENN